MTKRWLSVSVSLSLALSLCPLSLCLRPCLCSSMKSIILSMISVWYGSGEKRRKE
ncbi:unnamed protein product [Brugia timori]|uniref:Secreted protein n=1 Tax=Brugia timori TaxID=42155 RepID=A0A0R3QWL8_9BILA|nr:unnamed protein product [Brugia timori]